MSDDVKPALSQELKPNVPNYRPLFTTWGIRSLSRAIGWWWQRGEYRRAAGLCFRIPAAVAWSIRYGGWDAARNDAGRQ